MNNSESESHVREKKAIEDKMKALRIMAQSCQQIGAMTRSYLIRNQFCTNDDGMASVKAESKSTIWTGCKEWDTEIPEGANKHQDSLDVSYALFKISHVAEAKAQDRPLEVCKAETYYITLQPRRL